MILPQGPTNAKIVIVGDVTTPIDSNLGRAFSGSPGFMLDELLTRTGISRSNCLITNMFDERIPWDSTRSVYDKGKPTSLWEAKAEKLRNLMIQTQPNVIVPMGEESFRALTGKRGLANYRGSILNTPYGKVIGTWHPEIIMKSYELRAIALLDLRRAFNESWNRAFTEERFEFNVTPTIDQVMDFLNSLSHRFAFDIETIGHNIRMLGIANGRNSALCIPFMTIQDRFSTDQHALFANLEGSKDLNSYWTYDEEMAILQKLAEIFINPKILKIAQNFPFDATVLAREFGFEINGLFMDTMVAQHCCYPELPKGLDFLASIYTRIPYWSDYDSKNDYDTRIYNCYDCVATYQVCDALISEMSTLGVSDFYYSMAQPAMLALAKASNRGVQVDLEMRAKLAAECKAKIATCLENIKKLTKIDLNPNSPKQMKEFLYDKLRLPVQYNKERKDTTNEEAVRKLAKSFPQYKEIFDNLLEYRDNAKLLGTFLSCELDERGRMRTSYNATGTVTGRISSSKTIWGEGGNLQNIDTRIRNMYIAPKVDGPRKRKLVKADGSQAEARVVAWRSKNRYLIEKFPDPEFDVHTHNATLVFKIKPEDVRKIFRNGKSYRDIGKRVVHATNYRGSYFVVMASAGLNASDAKKAISSYMESSPELLQWWRDTEATVLATRKLKNVFGRQRIFMGRMNEETFRSATAFCPQSDVGDLINRAFFMLDEELPDGAFPILQVHDEVVVECWEDQVEEVASLITKHMTIELKYEGVDEPLSIPCEIKVGDAWGSLMPIDEWRKEKNVTKID